MENGNWNVVDVSKYCWQHQVGMWWVTVCYSMLYTYSPGPILAAMAWARDEGASEVGIGGTTEHHRERVRRNGGHHQIPQYQKQEWRSNSDCTVNGGCRMQQGWCRVLSLSLLVMTMSGRNTDLIVVIPHVENGGYKDIGGDFGPGASSRDRY